MLPSSRYRHSENTYTQALRYAGPAHIVLPRRRHPTAHQPAVSCRGETKMSIDTTQTVQYWWDSQDPQNAGWYVRVQDERGQTMDD